MNKLKYLFMDIDGTLTDGKIYMGSNGEAMKAFNIKDGYGIHDIAIPNDIIPVIITGRTSDIVVNRCKELGINHIYQGVYDKVAKMKEIIAETVDELDYACAYIGDDIPDVAAMNFCKESGGVIGCPADAVDYVKNIADFVSIYNGGNGAVRDFIEWLCSK